MLTIDQVNVDRAVKHRALMESMPAFRNGCAYVKIMGKHGRNVIAGFIRNGRRWVCTEIGADDYPAYAGLFPAEESPMNDYAMLRALADDNQQDPVSNAAVKIVDKIHRDIDAGVPWYDQQLSDTVEECLRSIVTDAEAVRYQAACPIVIKALFAARDELGQMGCECPTETEGHKPNCVLGKIEAAMNALGLKDELP